MGIDACKRIEDFYQMTDIVYIASPHETHYSYIKQSLQHDKHVLCENLYVSVRSRHKNYSNMQKEEAHSF